MKSRVQELASLAYACVKGMKGSDVEKKYSSYVRRLPSMITHNGLLTTVAFIRSKAGEAERDSGSLEKKAWKTIEDHIKSYLVKIENKEVSESLTEFFANMELSEYRLYTQKLLFFAQWLKRIAEGELKSEGGE